MEATERDSTGPWALAQAAGRPVLLGLFCGLCGTGLLGLLLERAGWGEAESLSLCLIVGFLASTFAVSLHALVCFVCRPGAAGPAIAGGALFVVLAASLLVGDMARSALSVSGFYPLLLVLSVPFFVALLWTGRRPRERARVAGGRPAAPHLANLASSLRSRL